MTDRHTFLQRVGMLAYRLSWPIRWWYTMFMNVDPDYQNDTPWQLPWRDWLWREAVHFGRLFRWLAISLLVGWGAMIQMIVLFGPSSTIWDFPMPRLIFTLVLSHASFFIAARVNEWYIYRRP